MSAYYKVRFREKKKGAKLRHKRYVTEVEAKMTAQILAGMLNFAELYVEDPKGKVIYRWKSR